MSVLVVGGAGYLAVTRLAHCGGRDITSSSTTICLPDLRSSPKASSWWKAILATRQNCTEFLRAWTQSCILRRMPMWENRSRTQRKYFRNNVSDALTLLNAAVDAGVRHFAFSSTCAVYGIPEHIPISEQTPREPRQSSMEPLSFFFENALEACRSRIWHAFGAASIF